MMLNEDDHVRGKWLERRRRPDDEIVMKERITGRVLHIKYECVRFVAELRWLPGSEGRLDGGYWIWIHPSRSYSFPQLDDEGSSG